MNEPVDPSTLPEIDDTLLLQLIDQTLEHRNRMSEQEFEEFIPLFTKLKTETGDEVTDELELHTHNEKLKELGNKWAMRVSQNSEVVIYDDIDPDVIVRTLPASIGTIATINTVLGSSAPLLTDALMNAIKRDDGFRDNVTPTVNTMIKVIQEAQKSPEVVAKKKRFTELEAKIVVPPTPEVQAFDEIKEAFKAATWS